MIDWTEPAVDRVEIRLLGPLQVRRADGSLVHPHEWRTGKTVDLLRILALRSGQVVRVGEVLGALWPQVDEGLGRVSLRNALAQLRRVLGPTSIQRRPDGLVLHDAWVDSTALRSLAAEARRHSVQGRLSTAVRVAREAEALYLGPLNAHDRDAMWVIPERAALDSAFRELLLEAADHAVELGWMRDGVELARRALDVDHTSERAFRALMRAHAGLGETDRALREFDRCRAVLAEELGVDPSPHTRALHVQLPSVESVHAAAVPLVGRVAELAELVGALERSASTGFPEVVYVGGVGGSGRARLVREAADRVGAQLTVVSAGEDGAGDVVDRVRRALAVPPGIPETDRATAQAGALVLVTGAGTMTGSERVALLQLVAAAAGPAVVVLLVTASARALLELDLGASQKPPPATLALQLMPLSGAELTELATVLLAGPVSPQLLASLEAETGGSPGPVRATLARWSGAGRVAATAGGLVLVPPVESSVQPLDASVLLAQAMELLDGDDIDLLHLVVLFDRPVRPGVLRPMLGVPPRGPPTTGAVLTSLERLVDRQLLVAGPDGHQMRDPVLQQAVQSWLRATTRRRLHHRIAGSADLSTAERVRHWRAAGDVELASRASMAAAEEATAAGDTSAVRAHLLVVLELAESSGATADVQADVLERIADAGVQLGRLDEAVEHYRGARALSDGADTVRPLRIAEKITRLDHALVRERDVPALAPTTPAGAEPGDGAAETPDGEGQLRAAVAAADAVPDHEASVRTRLQLVEHALLPGRALTEARSLTEQAVRLAGDGRLRAAAVALHLLPDILLGNARAAEPALDAAWGVADQNDPGAGRLRLLRCLVDHDLGRHDFAARWAELTVADRSDGADDSTWARVRMLTERGSLADALAADRRPVPPDAAPLPRQLRRLASATLLTALRREPEAVQVLLAAVSESDDEGCTLLLPEITARLVILSAETESETALKHFELFDWVAGAHIGQPREGYLRLLARAAIRAAHGQLDRAAAAAANAARIAEDSGLVLLASEAFLVQAQYLYVGGWPSGARLATAAAARCLRAAGAAG